MTFADRSAGAQQITRSRSVAATIMQIHHSAKHFLIGVLGLMMFLGISSTKADAHSPKSDLLEIEQRLSALGYPVLKVDGVSDASTYHAIVAFQKVEGLKRTGKFSSGLLESLRFAQRPPARFKTGENHVEVDISRQILFVTDELGSVVYILPVSTGNEKPYIDKGVRQIARTPRGQFRIERKINGVRVSSLGSLYYPSYFYGGFAIHGSPSVPTYPASHGCVRIPRFAERKFFAMAPIGMEVFIYD